MGALAVGALATVIAPVEAATAPQATQGRKLALIIAISDYGEPGPNPHVFLQPRPQHRQESVEVVGDEIHRKRCSGSARGRPCLGRRSQESSVTVGETPGHLVAHRDRATRQRKLCKVVDLGRSNCAATRAVGGGPQRW